MIERTSTDIAENFGSVSRCMIIRDDEVIEQEIRTADVEDVAMKGDIVIVYPAGADVAVRRII